MREVLRGARDHRRELTLEAKFQGDQSCLDASGAIRLTIRDFLPTLEGDLGLPPGLEVATGVDAAEVWPVSINDVEIEWASSRSSRLALPRFAVPNPSARASQWRSAIWPLTRLALTC